MYAILLNSLLLKTSKRFPIPEAVSHISTVEVNDFSTGILFSHAFVT